jgi:hypothetical protein
MSSLAQADQELETVIRKLAMRIVVPRMEGLRRPVGNRQSHLWSLKARRVSESWSELEIRSYRRPKTLIVWRASTWDLL